MEMTSNYNIQWLYSTNNFPCLEKPGAGRPNDDDVHLFLQHDARRPTPECAIKDNFSNFIRGILLQRGGKNTFYSIHRGLAHLQVR